MPFDPTPLKDRSAIQRALRRFFDNLGYLEADTPILTPYPIPEAHISLFRTESILPDKASSNLFLVPSPEVWLKLLLAEGASSLYQIAPCFRNGEQEDRWHRPEFRMLEWYTVEASAKDNIAVMQDVLDTCIEAIRPKAPEDVSGRITTMTMEEAFRTFAGFSLESDLKNSGWTETCRNNDEEMAEAALSRTAETLAARLRERGLPDGGDCAYEGKDTGCDEYAVDTDGVNGGCGDTERNSPADKKSTGESTENSSADRETADDLFHRLFVTLVEDMLPTESPLILTDWPAFIPTLARRIPGTPWSERWELYIRGIEVANCYGEETDAAPLTAYWRSESEQKARFGDPVPTDPLWPKKIAAGMPLCSGVAVGLDRLLALIRGDEDLKGLDLFPKHDMIRR